MSRSHQRRRAAKVMDRRNFVGLSLLGVGTAVAFPALAPPRARALGGGKIRLDADVSTGAGVAYHPPYAIQSDCVLSEDHFLVRNGAIDPAKDTVVAYSRADGQVEAMLLQNGTVSQVYRDPAAPGGWNIRAVAAGATDMVAGLSAMDTSGPTLHVFYRTVAGKVTHLEEEPPGTDGLSSGKFTAVDSFDWGAGVPGRLQITCDVAQGLLVFSLAPSSAPGQQDARLGFYTKAPGLVNAGVLSGFEFNGEHGVRGGSAVISYAYQNFHLHPTLLLYVPSPHRTSVDVYQYSLQLNTTNLSITDSISKFAQQPPDYQPADFGSATVESVDYVSSPGGLYLPIAVVRSSDQELYTLTKEVASQPAWHLRQLVLPPRDSSQKQPGTLRWEPSNIALNPPSSQIIKTNNLLNLFMVIDGTLSVVRQVGQSAPAKDAVTPVFNPAVPLQDGVATAASQIMPSAGDELMVVAKDGNLQMMTKTAAGGWVASEIHLPASEPAELTTYRVQLTLTDDWGAPVAGQELRVTSATPVTALVGGKGVALSGQAVTVITDARGQVMIPVLADGLSAPTLTVAGAGLPTPVTVSPSGPVNTYLTGTGTLNYLPVFGAHALAGATTGSGTPLYPLASRDQDVAVAAANVLTGAAKAGANPTTSTISAATGHAGRHHAVRLGTPPVGASKVVSAYGIELSFGDLVHDAIHAIKTGAAKVKAIVVSFDDTVNKWVSQVSADFAAWASQEVKVVIGGLDDAADVFHSVINHLGAALADVIDWLRAHVLSLLTDTVALAARYDGWLLQLCNELTLLIGDAKKGTGTFFASQQSLIHAQLGKLKAGLGARPINSLSQSTQVTAVHTAGATPAPAPPTGAQSNWLLQKITEGGPSTSGIPAPAGDFQTLVQDVRTKLSAAGRDFASAASSFNKAVSGFVANPRNFGAVGIGSLIDALGNVIDAALTMADGLTQVVLDLVAIMVEAFKTLIGTSLTDLPLIGPLLRSAGMRTAPTIGGVATLMIAFPTVLGYKLAHHDGNARPFQGTTTTSTVHAQDAGDDLRYVTALATAYWAWMDSIAAMQAANGTTPPEFFAWVDMVTPMLLSALTVPAHDGGLPFTSAIDLSDGNEDLIAVAWATGALPGLFAAVSYYATKKYTAPEADAIANNMLNLTSCAGTVGAALGVGAALATTDTVQDAISPALVAVLGNIGAVMAVGMDSQAVESTEGVSAIAVAVVGLICGTAAAAILGNG